MQFGILRPQFVRVIKKTFCSSGALGGIRSHLHLFISSQSFELIQ
jgi:hypothetical protein